MTNVAHRRVFEAVRSGRLERQPCEVCGAGKVQAHHVDYDRPLDVQWLCRLHHKQAHDLEQRAGFGARLQAARYEQGWTQRALADEANVCEATIVKAERSGNVRLAPFLRILAALNLSVREAVA